MHSPLADAARYWEPRRLIYNLLLTLLVAVFIGRTWPAFRPAFESLEILRFLILAFLANLCYSAVYLVELSVPQSADSSRPWRTWLFVGGTLFALLLAQYWIGDEIYSAVLRMR